MICQCPASHQKNATAHLHAQKEPFRAYSFPDTGQIEQDAGLAGNIEECGPDMNFTKNKIRKVRACLQLFERNERLL